MELYTFRKGHTENAPNPFQVSIEASWDFNWVFLFPSQFPVCLVSWLPKGSQFQKDLKGQGQNKGEKDKSMMPKIKGRSGSFNTISLFEQHRLPSLTFRLYLYRRWKTPEPKTLSSRQNK